MIFIISVKFGFFLSFWLFDSEFLRSKGSEVRALGKILHDF